MGDSWRPRCQPPSDLVRPVPVDPTGVRGPTAGQARGPFWRRSSPRLYVPASVDATVVEQRILEESMRLPEGGAVTGWAALRLAGAGFFDGLAADGRTTLDVPLVLPPGRDIRRAPGFRVTRERLPESETTIVGGTRCTVPLRAVFDEARRAPSVRTAAVVIDMAAVSGLIRLTELDGYLAGKSRWTGVHLVTTALADERGLSPRETQMRLIWVLDAGLPRPRCNWPVADGEGRSIGRPDLLCEELAVVGEFDGADHRSRRQHRADVRREDLFRRAGLECFTLVGADLDDVASVVERMHATVERARRSGVPRTWRTRRHPGGLW